MANLLDPVNPGTQLQSGDPQYQQQQFQSRQRLIAPQYNQAIQRARQNSQNRGLLNSGLGQEEEQQVGQEFRNQTNANAGEAALTGADQAEYNRRQAIAQAFALQQQKIQNEQQQALQNNQLASQATGQWQGLLNGAAGAVGKGAAAALFA